MKLLANWRTVAARSYSFLFAAASTAVGAAAVVQQFTPVILPMLPPGAAVPLAAVLAGAATLGRLMDQGIAPPVAPPGGQGSAP